MSISSISSSYTSALYQWQNQQLTSSGSTSSQSSASSSLSSLLGSYSITSQVSSMVELTQYAMDAMGLSDDSRVTFNQILKYRDQLTSEFNASVPGRPRGPGGERPRRRHLHPGGGRAV